MAPSSPCPDQHERAPCSLACEIAGGESIIDPVETPDLQALTPLATSEARLLAQALRRDADQSLPASSACTAICTYTGPVVVFAANQHVGRS